MALEQAEAAARALWPDLARAAGLPASGWQAMRLAGRSDARVSRVLLRLRGHGRDVVLKHEMRPWRPEAFAAALAAHRAARAGFASAAGPGLPALLAADPARQAALYEYAEARPLLHLLAAADPAEQRALLRRVGAWLGAFHAARPGIRRVFRPPANLRQLHAVLDELAAGTRAVAEPARFAACAERLLALAPRYGGRETVTAHQHGDLHMRNVLVGEHVWGIDLAPGAVRPVGHDIARLLIDYAARIADPGAVSPGAALPDRALTAFLNGYRTIGADDPSLGLLLRLRILADWWGLPAEDDARTLAQGRRLAGLLALSERTFGVS
ncbi:phosphotransferase [Roseivivax sp. CAU 1761]